MNAPKPSPLKRDWPKFMKSTERNTTSVRLIVCLKNTQVRVFFDSFLRRAPSFSSISSPFLFSPFHSPFLLPSPNSGRWVWERVVRSHSGVRGRAPVANAFFTFTHLQVSKRISWQHLSASPNISYDPKCVIRHRFRRPSPWPTARLERTAQFARWSGGRAPVWPCDY